MRARDFLREAIDTKAADVVYGIIAKLIAEGHTEVSPQVIMTKVSAALGRPFMLKDLVAANNSSEQLQTCISSINPTKVKFSTDILTVKNENPAKEKAKTQTAVSSMASRAASRPRLGENLEYDDDEEEEEDEEDSDEGFYVVIANEEDGVFIGMLVKEDGRWYERKVSGQPPRNWGGPKYMSYLKPRDIMRWLHQDFGRHYEVRGPFPDSESAEDAANYMMESKGPSKPRNFVAKHAQKSGAGAHKNLKKAVKQGDVKHKKKPEDVAEGSKQRPIVMYKEISPDMLKGRDFYQVVQSQSPFWKVGDTFSDDDMSMGSRQVRFISDTGKEQGVSEGIIKESGETYTWTAHYRDGSEKKLNIATDEVDAALSVFKKYHPGNIVKVTTDWKPVDTSSYFKSGSWGGAIPDRRPTEPFGHDVDNPMIRGLEEDKDACYRKVKSRYKVWPSAYASGALSKCRKVGASNWGNKSKK